MFSFSLYIGFFKIFFKYKMVSYHNNIDYPRMYLIFDNLKNNSLKFWFITMN